jgi:hypothetical protein
MRVTWTAVRRDRPRRLQTHLRTRCVTGEHGEIEVRDELASLGALVAVAAIDLQLIEAAARPDHFDRDVREVVSVSGEAIAFIGSNSRSFGALRSVHEPTVGLDALLVEVSLEESSQRRFDAS